jgi:LPS sulfotransferase NodH
MNPNSQYIRPDVIDLTGPDFDYISPEPAGRTLLICAGPRTGSFELCRYLIAAGIGVPHEYFNRFYARRLAARWGILSNPLAEPGIARYIDTLRRRRTQGGVFAAKLGFFHFDQWLRNQHGAALFEGAQVVHLFRPDVAGQYASVRIARQTGIWDFSERQTFQIPLPAQRSDAGKTPFEQALSDLDELISEDTGFRKLFVLLGIRPLFVTSDELFQNPRSVVQRIADSLGVPVNEAALEESVAHGGAYKRESKRQQTVPEFTRQFKEVAFKKP